MNRQEKEQLEALRLEQQRRDEEWEETLNKKDAELRAARAETERALQAFRQEMEAAREQIEVLNKRLKQRDMEDDD